ncbi:hypothetical protein J7T55_011361 [Diaporthe amygdali]|uniref:uncharacterized protein n=1 Tax=Phomopsis amygdali TaxID=1214568 RepID=UPI0022FE73D8|nr:uncharacterized protein J7T55_011361 [Diaporthe amygdali]KAJ0122900.1 hypothetical protein J7T55_011361 [Diaporthe amygdali]
MRAQHARAESASATMRRPPSPSSSSSSPSATRLPGPARIRNLRSALRGLSISDPSPPTVSPRAPLSPLTSIPWTGTRRPEWSPQHKPSSNSYVLEPSPQKNDISSASWHASEEATNRALLEGKVRQLKGYTQRLRAARIPGSDPGSVDSAYEEFARVRDEAAEAVGSLLAARNASGAASRSRRARNGSVAETVERLESLRIAHGNANADGEVDTLKASFSTLGLGDSSFMPTGPIDEEKTPYDRGPAVLNSPVQNDPSLTAVRDWRAALVKLLQSHRRSLAATLQAYDRDATLEVTDRAFDDLNYRAEVIQKIRTRKAPLPSNDLIVSPAYWAWYERRFQHYDIVRKTIMQIDRLLQLTSPAVGDGRRKTIRDYVIAPRGNAILEFANTGHYDSPLLRFRVSSHMLAETSPIFEAVFGGQFSNPRILDRDLRELDGQMPSEPPRTVAYADGNRVKVYSMPQLELNKEEALTVLLYAAHMQNDKVPREISFEQFTAIAEVCLKYQCTSPLELFVEHRWLPAWMHKASEPQPDGILLISYAFGMRQLFTRMSKTSVLNIVDEEQLRSKPWPQAMKDRVWAVRNAKLAQVYSACAGAVQEYFRPPGQASSDGGLGANSEGQRSGAGISPNHDPSRTSSLLRASSSNPAPPSYVSLFSLTSTPRCPRGDHWCDATSMGWLLLVLNELQLAWTVINPSVMPAAQGQQSQPQRSLAQILDVLRSIPSPPHAAHPGSTVCDPAPAFRAAVNDVYNSISGLTLFEVDGKRHGWGLSKHRVNQPQTVQKVSLGKLNGLSLAGLSLEDDAVAPALNTTNEYTRELLAMETEDWVPANNSTETDIIGEEDDDMTDDMQWRHYNQPSAFAPDEALGLRILRHADTFDDLHALALVSRAFYAAFKKNELALMRPLARRQTLSTLAGGPPQPQVLLPEELARLERIQARAEADPHVPPPFVSHQSMDDDSLAEAAQLESSCSTDVEGGIEGEGEGEEPREMTEEEARQILWPDQPAGSDRNSVPRYLTKGKAVEPPAWATVAREDSGEKFLAGDISLTEDKSLAVLGDKSLGEDLDRRKGITSA